MIPGRYQSAFEFVHHDIAGTSPAVANKLVAGEEDEEDVPQNVIDHNHSETTTMMPRQSISRLISGENGKSRHHPAHTRETPIPRQKVSSKDWGKTTALETHLENFAGKGIPFMRETVTEEKKERS